MMPKAMPGRPRLSIVVPAPSDTAALEETLVSVLENRPDDCEIVVGLGCEYDDPWNIREEVRFVQAPIGSSMVACANVGIASSEGEVIHVLAAGWRATEGWTDGPVARFDNGQTAAVVPLTVADDDHDRIVAAGIRYGRGGRRIPVQFSRKNSAASLVAKTARPHGPALEAGFWRADFLRQAGPGFSTACGDSCADADMAVAASRGRRRVDLDGSSRVVGGASRQQRKASFLAGLHAERLFWRSIAGQSLPVAIVMHLVEVARHSLARAPFGTLPMLAGRLVALLQFGSYLPRYRQLRALLEASREAADSSAVPTIRIDGPHAAIGRPKGSRTAVAPLRRSA